MTIARMLHTPHTGRQAGRVGPTCLPVPDTYAVDIAVTVNTDASFVTSPAGVISRNWLN